MRLLLVSGQYLIHFLPLTAGPYYYVQIIILLIFRKTINAETVMFAVVQLIRGAIIAVIKQYSHFCMLRFLDFAGQF